MCLLGLCLKKSTNMIMFRSIAIYRTRKKKIDYMRKKPKAWNSVLFKYGLSTFFSCHLCLTPKKYLFTFSCWSRWVIFCWLNSMHITLFTGPCFSPGFTARMCWTCSGQLMVHFLFLDQLIILASSGMWTKVRKIIHNHRFQ